MYVWKITGTGLHDLYISASSFDEALKEARKINRNYCGGQVYEKI